MQISSIIPGLYSLRRGWRGDSNNSTSRQLHKCLRSLCKSSAISGMPGIIQRLIISPGFRQAQALPSTLPPWGWHPWQYPPCSFCTSRERVMDFPLILGPSISNNMQDLLGKQTISAADTSYKPWQVLHPWQPLQWIPQGNTPTLSIKILFPNISLLSLSETPKGLHHKGTFLTTAAPIYLNLFPPPPSIW